MLDSLVNRLVTTLSAHHVTVWHEEQAWRYLREMLPSADEQLLQQIADRAQWAMRRS